MIRSCNRSFRAITCFWINSVTRFSRSPAPNVARYVVQTARSQINSSQHCFSCKSRMIVSSASPSRFNLYPQNYTIYVNRPVPTGNCYYCLESAKNLYAKTRRRLWITVIQLIKLVPIFCADADILIEGSK